MQKKTLLYVFGIAAFLGLILGTGYFANELRLKIISGPAKDQFSLGEGQKGVSLNPNFSNKSASSKSAQSLPTLPGGQGQPKEAAPSADSETEPTEQPKKEEEKAASYSFAVIGDTQRFDPNNANGGLQKAVKNIEGKNVGLVMTDGDLLSSCDGKSGCEKKLGEWKKTLGSLYAKTYEMMGNHDRTGDDKSDALWQKFFDLPSNGPEGYKELVYSFDFENSHFVVLNSEKPKEHAVNKTQRDWLEKDLSDNKKDNTFVFFHEPAYPVSSKMNESLDVEKSDRDALWKVLKDNKVSAVFNGHEHIASRRAVDGIQQFVFGNTDSFDHDLPEAGVAEYSYRGKSYGIVEVNGKKITVKTYSVDGSEQNSFDFSSI